MTWRRLLDRLLARRGHAPAEPPVTPVPAAPRTHGLPEAELLARAEEFNRGAEAHWRELAREPSGRAHALNKPFSGPATAPEVVYRLGLLLSELRLGVGLVVLDFGAGSCWLSSCLNRLGCRTVSVDVSPSALELGRELFALDPRHRGELEPRFLPYDGHRIPLPEASVDRVACFDAFHHVPNQDEVLSEMFRVLRDGGRAVLAEPAEGHAGSGSAVFDAERYGVLENELDVLDLDRRARRAGFTDVRLKPYPHPAALSVSAGEYAALAGGETSAFPFAALAESLRASCVATLVKGEERWDSRCPGRLAAAMRLVEPVAPLRARAGSTLDLVLDVENIGDTLWLHRVEPEGGSVLLGSHLLDEGRKPVRADFCRTKLPEDVPPGATVRVRARLPVPPDPGRYVLRLDPVDDRLAWFSQAGSPPLDLDLVVEEDPGAPRHRARLELLAGGPGLRLAAGQRRSLRVRVTNLGPSAWPGPRPERAGAYRLGAQLLDARGEVLDRERGRADLVAEVGAGASADLDLWVEAPVTAGDYRLRLDMLQETVFWFAQRGSSPLDVPLTVTGEAAESADPGVLAAALELLSPALVRGTAGETAVLRLRATNRGNTRWLCHRPERRGQVSVGGHLRRPSAAEAADWLRSPLPRDVEPGETVEVEVVLRLPEEPGRHELTLALVDEGIAWFGTPPLAVTLEGEAPPAAAS